MSATWAAVLAGSVGCYLIKLLGLSFPQRLLRDRRVRKIGALLPISLLATLIAIDTFSTGHHLTVDARAAGIAAAVVAQRFRAPFLVVVAVAAATAAVLRAAA